MTHFDLQKSLLANWCLLTSVPVIRVSSHASDGCLTDIFSQDIPLTFLGIGTELAVGKVYFACKAASRF